MSRILRCFVCLALICCILVNLFPVRSEATAAGLAGSIAAVSTINVPAGLVYGAAAMALGFAAGTNDDFMNMVDSAVSAVGDWIKDGTVELLQTVDAAGQKAYYVADELLEDLRGWVYSSNVVGSVSAVCGQYIAPGEWYNGYQYSVPVYAFKISGLTSSSSRYQSIRSHRVIAAEPGVQFYQYITNSDGSVTSYSSTRSVLGINGVNHYLGYPVFPGKPLPCS